MTRVLLLTALVACSNKPEQHHGADKESTAAAVDEAKPEGARDKAREVPAHEAFEHVGARGELPEGYTARIEPGDPPVVRLEGPGPLLQISRLADDDVPVSVDDPRWLGDGVEVRRSENLDGGWLAEVSSEGAPADIWAQIRAAPGQVLLCVSVNSEDARQADLARRFCRAVRPR